MAAPIAHIFLALQVLSGPLKNKFNEREFIIGTSFPDIRYLNIIKRDETHFKNVTFEQVKNEKNSFTAGMLFHSLVDEKREEYMVKNHVYNKISQFQFATQSLKFAEDQILIKTFDIHNYDKYFNVILNEERQFKIDENDLKNWHQFLKEYCNSNISIKTLLRKYFELNYPKASFLKKYYFLFFVRRKVEKTIKNIINDSILNKIILDFYFNFLKNQIN